MGESYISNNLTKEERECKKCKYSRIVESRIACEYWNLVGSRVAEHYKKTGSESLEGFKSGLECAHYERKSRCK